MSRASIKAINAYTALCKWERLVEADPISASWSLREFRRYMAKTTKEEFLRTRLRGVPMEQRLKQWDEMVGRTSDNTSAVFNELNWHSYKRRRWQRRVADLPAGYTIWETRVGTRTTYDIAKGVLGLGPGEITERRKDLDPLTAQAVLFDLQQTNPQAWGLPAQTPTTTP